MPAKKYRIKLTLDERAALENLVDKGSQKATKYKRAMVMLLSDESELGSSYSDSKIQEVTRMRLRTIERLRKRCHEVGPIVALERVSRENPAIEPKITGEVEAAVTQIACTLAPDGCSRWTLSLIAEEAVRLEIIESISPASVGRILKKVNLNHGKPKAGV